MFKHKPCNVMMGVKHQCARRDEYPQTHTCPICGAYIFTNTKGVNQYFAKNGNQTSDPSEEFEEIN